MNGGFLLAAVCRRLLSRELPGGPTLEAGRNQPSEKLTEDIGGCPRVTADFVVFQCHLLAVIIAGKRGFAIWGFGGRSASIEGTHIPH